MIKLRIFKKKMFKKWGILKLLELKIVFLEF